jgi:(2R)-sulfolactate sulfo-lyase subunit alpha
LQKKVWIHAKPDVVGVAVGDIGAKEKVVAAFMDGKGDFRLVSREAVPLGHKIALRDIKKGEKVVEYGEVIGAATKPIGAGEHVHTHNLKTLRWA